MGSGGDISEGGKMKGRWTTSYDIRGTRITGKKGTGRKGVHNWGNEVSGGEKKNTRRGKIGAEIRGKQQSENRRKGNAVKEKTREKGYTVARLSK